ncbi:MAG: hypothetical protein ACI4TU_06575 [Candidatus Cryptobacteroides sp.]
MKKVNFYESPQCQIIDIMAEGTALCGSTLYSIFEHPEEEEDEFSW